MEIKIFKSFIKIFFLIILFIPSFLFAASLNITSSASEVKTGDIVNIKVVLNSSGAAVNSAEGVLNFPSDILEVISLDKSNSIFSIWVEDPSFSNSIGTISFSGGLPSPGFIGTNGKVISVVFHAKKSGTATFNISDGAVRADDGSGTSVLNGVSGAQINVSSSQNNLEKPQTIDEISQTQQTGITIQSKISSPTHPDSNKWYNNSDPVFKWDLPAGALAVKIQYDKNPNSDPSVVYNTPISQKQLNGLSDGTYYFHLRIKNKNGWGAASHFKFNVDTTPPNDFSVKMAHAYDVNDPRPIITFNTTDGLSGISYYDIKINDKSYGQFTEDQAQSNPYSIPEQEPGKKLITVLAYDNAGNVKVESTEIEIQAITPPRIDSYQTELTSDDIFKIRGHSYPDSTIKVSIKDHDGVITTDYTKTNSLGDFSLVWTKRLSKGSYTFSAIVIDNKGAQSYPTDNYTFVVKESFLIRTGGIVLNYLSAILLLIIFVGIVIVAIYYTIHHVGKFRRKLRGDIETTQKTIDRDFECIKEDLSKHIAMLESTKKKRVLTKEEEIVFKSIKKHLAIMEEDINSKVENLKKEIE